MADRTTPVTVSDGDQLSEGYFNGVLNYGYLGEIRQFALSVTGAITKAALQTAGWAICDGTNAAAQGIASADITAVTPNLDNKFIMGSDNETSGTTGGESTHALSTAEMPAHTHVIERSDADGTNARAREGDADDGDITTSSTGSGTAHENKPPFYELVFFMKVKLAV